MMVAKEIAFARLDACASCEHLFKPTFTCKKCGCFMKVKARIASQHCALPPGERKWEAHEEAGMSDTDPIIDPEDEPVVNPDESPERDDSEPVGG